VLERLEARLLEERDALLAALLDDALSCERIRYRLSQNRSDLTRDVVNDLRLAVWRASGGVLEFAVADSTRLVIQRWDWKAWLGTGGRERPGEPARVDDFVVIHQSANAIRIRRLKQRHAEIVNVLARRPGRATDVLAAIPGSVRGDGRRGAALTDTNSMTAELVRLSESGVLDVSAVYPLEGYR
jgi:hypothetical protein